MFQRWLLREHRSEAISRLRRVQRYDQQQRKVIDDEAIKYSNLVTLDGTPLMPLLIDFCALHALYSGVNYNVQ